MSQDNQISLQEKLIQSSLTSSDYYWNSYAHFGIHEEMLKDKVRTLSYKDSILNNRHLFQDKVVLDVGCGTGILSMFCARAGAAKVYAVEFSDIIVQAKMIANANGLGDKIEFIQAKMEEVELPEKVDIIISEWMGYFLFYESMLSSVIVARNKFLKEGGLIFPDKANLFVSMIEDSAYKREKIEFWDNVYGFDYSCIKPIAYREPLVDIVDMEALISNSCCVYSVDIYTVQAEDLEFEVEWECTFNENDMCHGMIAWFDIEFSACHVPVRFSTAPYSKSTHWKQTVFYLEQDIKVVEGDSINGVLKVSLNEENPRDLDIEVQYNFEGKVDSLNILQHYQLK
eukprot:TRINITY_DN222_c0_g3_i1.p1 TRINITY_DN222_c0_g3~~TRINITY_DN222_c0_g3_i1.p1  ORF type:complete len:342 (-),score=75.98 TRINITY_DN222_c0_g3_i1:28-1053(-)